VSDVPDQLIARRVEDVMERERKLDDTQAGADVTAGARADLYEIGAHLVGERSQLVAREALQVSRRLDAIE
jgi:hypothetical protein